MNIENSILTLPSIFNRRGEVSSFGIGLGLFVNAMDKSCDFEDDVGGLPFKSAVERVYGDIIEKRTESLTF